MKWILTSVALVGVGLGSTCLLVSDAHAGVAVAGAPAQKTPASAAAQPDLVEPIPGTLVLAGDGGLSESALGIFVERAGAGEARVVVLSSSKVSRKDTKRWEAAGAGEVTFIRAKAPSDLTDAAALLPLVRATGIWVLDEMPKKVREDPLFAAFLEGVLARDGAVGGAGKAAQFLGASDGLGLLPDSVIAIGSTAKAVTSSLKRANKGGSGLVGWGITKGAALVVHQGRRVCAVEAPVEVLVSAAGDWPERSQSMEPMEGFTRWDELPYSADLLAWTRSARDRTGPLFPPQEAPTPIVAKGTLLLHGGGGVDDETWDRFIEAAGGKDASFVCIPSAGEGDDLDRPSSYSARNLRERGCDDITIMHTRDRAKAGGDEVFLKSLREADGVWMDGGRTYRLMDAYQHTTVHDLLFDVLERGGVVAGSSAGCQAQGDFLMRGDPRTNKSITWDGYETGFGLLKGVIIDAHFSQRSREEPFIELIGRHPQMLGIGVDEGTGLFITGSTGEVVGENAVLFYDASGEEPHDFVSVKQGNSYDLANRRATGD